MMKMMRPGPQVSK